MFVGSDPDVSGSVIEKHDRLWPFSTGSRNFSFCSSVPCWWRISMLPGVGRRAVEDHGRHQAAAHDLAEHPVLPVGQADTDLLVRHEEVPEALCFGLLAQLDDGVRISLSRVARDFFVERLDELALTRVIVLVEEAVYALEQLGDAIEGVKSKTAGNLLQVQSGHGPRHLSRAICTRCRAWRPRRPGGKRSRPASHSATARRRRSAPPQPASTCRRRSRAGGRWHTCRSRRG